MTNQQITDDISTMLEKINLNVVLHAIREEDEHSLAIFLLTLPPKYSASILSRLNAERRNAIAREIAVTETAPSEEVQEIAGRLKSKIEEAASRVTNFGDSAENLAKLLAEIDIKSQSSILKSLEEDKSEIAQRVKEKMFRFDDILLLTDVSMQTLLRIIDRNILALALRGASEEVQEKIFDNLSPDEILQIRAQMESNENISTRVITQAQQSILSAMRQLEYQGMIVMNKPTTRET